MKIFKKLLTLLTAFVMAFTIAVFAACAPVENDNKDPDSGNTDNPNDPDNPNQPVNDPDLTLINGVLTQNYVAVTQSLTGSQSGDNKYYSLTEDGKKGSALTDKNHKNTNKITQSAKFNLADGDADIVITEEQKSTPASDYDGKHYNYAFLRDWHSFSPVTQYDENYNHIDTTPITDFTGVTLEYGGSATGNMPFNAETLGGMGKLAGLGLGVENFVILSLGKYFGGFTKEGDVVTVDVNKMAYNLATKVNAFLAELDENTTVGDVLADDTVKAVLSSLLNGIPAATLTGVLQTVISSIPNIGEMLEALEIDLTKILVAPDANETTYDYFVRVISSNELKNALNAIIKAMIPAEPGAPVISMPTTLNNMTLDFFLNLAGTSVETIKSMVARYTEDVTESLVDITVITGYLDLSDGGRYEPDEEIGPDAVVVPETVNVKISNAKVVFTFNGNALTKQQADVSVVMSQSYVNRGNGHYDENLNEWIYDYYLCESVNTMNFGVTVDYSSEKHTLKDINANKTVEGRWQYVEQEVGIYLPVYRLEDGGDFNVEPREIEFIVKSVVENGLITDYMYKLADEPDSAYKPLGNTLTFEVTIVRWNEETSDYDSETISLTFNVEKVISEVSESGYPSGDPHVEIRNDEYDIGDYNHFGGETIYYGNTVSGILAGKESAYLPDYNNNRG